MRIIFKYPLSVVSIQSLSLPKRADILSVANQRGNLCLWAEVDEFENETEERQIEVIGTGHPIDGDHQRTFIGTVLIEPFVWHVFELLT